MAVPGRPRGDSESGFLDVCPMSRSGLSGRWSMASQSGPKPAIPWDGVGGPERHSSSFGMP